MSFAFGDEECTCGHERQDHDEESGACGYCTCSKFQHIEKDWYEDLEEMSEDWRA